MLFHAGRYRDAIERFQRLLNARLTNPHSPSLAMAQLELARADRQAGDPGNAPLALNQFRASWKNAEGDLPFLATVREEGR